jgi:hypothetical protein
MPIIFKLRNSDQSTSPAMDVEKSMATRVMMKSVSHPCRVPDARMTYPVEHSRRLDCVASL